MSPVRRWIGIVGAAAAGLAALLLTVTGLVSAAGAPQDHAARASSAPSAFQQEMEQSMGRMMEAMHAPRYSGNVDIDFLAMMIPHHAGAVDMARLVLQHGHDPATRQLAEDIIAGQTAEIDSMRRRLALLQQPRGDRASEFPSLGGTRGP